ncbi:chalcone synthase-like [Oryza brachyantha]|uniref:Chalcone synthase n=1 Tax=Oryza brachyantha TaxID=4533 RepID=J3NAA8_ORYBR|nr:chalcone synthase-like [Oryza brachyantha]
MGSSGAPELTAQEMSNIACGGRSRRATILGIGTAVPAHVYEQKSFPDYYFEITNSNHLVDLKAKFASICEKTSTEKRHMYISDEWLRANPSVTAYMSTSLNVRQQVAEEGIPRLGAEAARNAISDWGKPASGITHVVFATTSTGCLPSADCVLIKLLGLPPTTKRVMLYQAGCFGGTTALRVSKDIAENNPGARVLVVTSEVMSLVLRGPSESHIGNLVGQAVFGDAAGAVVVGCCPAADERPMFELVRASQDVIPGTEDAVVVKVRQEGVVITMHRDVPLHVSNSVGAIVKSALQEIMPAPAPEMKSDDMFWLLHAGGRGIVDGVEKRLALREEKLAATREVMRQYGNTRSSTVFLAMEEMRRRSDEQGMATAGEGLEWGMLIAFGPGLTLETMLLRALPIVNHANM